jgi:hypothetical protein
MKKQVSGEKGERDQRGENRQYGLLENYKLSLNGCDELAHEISKDKYS